MEKKTNIILLTGNDTYSIHLEVKKWVKLFSEKHSEFNIESWSLDAIKEDGGLVRQNIGSGGFFAGKRLFIFSGGNEKRDKTTDFGEFFTTIFSTLPDESFLLFHSLKDRALDLMPIIKKIGTVKEFDGTYSISLWEKRFTGLNPSIIKKVLYEYEMMESILEEWEKNTSISYLISGTLTNLELLSIDHPLTDSDLDDAIGGDCGAKIFDLIDTITNLDIKKSLILFKRIANTKTMFEFLPAYIGLLRNVLYIKYLDFNKISISSIKVHPYVIKKTLASKISYEKIAKLYTSMVRTSIAYKSGNGLKDIELGRILEIELGIIGLKK